MKMNAVSALYFSFTTLSTVGYGDIVPASPVARMTAMAEATNLARMLGYEPSNVITPSELALRAEKLAEQEGLRFEALGEEEMKRLGMGALLAVSRGSEV